VGVGELKVLYYLKQRLTGNAYVSGGLARLSDRSTLNLKQRPRAGCAVDVHLALALQGAPQKKLLQTDDAKEGLRAFAERRRPALCDECHSGHSPEVERMILFFPVREWRLRSQRSCPRGDATSTSGAPHANSFSRSTPRKFEREQADPDAHPRARTGTGRAVRLHRDEAITTNIAGLFHRNRRIVAAARSTKARSGLRSTRCRPKLSSVDDLSRCSGCARAPNC
jgi:hypothetical protein